MKSIEDQARAFSKFDSATDIGTDLGSYRQGLFEGFLAGYQAAKEHAHAALEEAEAEIDRLQTKLSDAGILTTEHLIDASKMVSSSETLNNWISVKDRLPEMGHDVLVKYSRLYALACRTKLEPPKLPPPQFNNVERWYWDFGDNYMKDGDKVTHWMELPEMPEERDE
jgi:hypothetical protein